MGNDLLEGFEGCAFTQSRDVKHREQTNVLGAVDLVERQVFNQFRRRTSGMHQTNRMLIRIDGIERHLHFCRHHARVNLADQRGHIRWKDRDMGLAQFQRIHQSEARVRVKA